MITGAVNTVSEEKPKRPMKDAMEYLVQTLHRVNLLMDQYAKQGYIELELSGVIGKFLPTVRIRLPERSCNQR